MCGHANVIESEGVIIEEDRLGSETIRYGSCAQCGERFLLSNRESKRDISKAEKLIASAVLAFIAFLVVLGLIFMHG